MDLGKGILKKLSVRLRRLKYFGHGIKETTNQTSWYDLNKLPDNFQGFVVKTRY